MIDLLSTTQVLLKDAGYTVRLSTIQRETLICFEDTAVMGFCSTFVSPEELIKKWMAYENEIISRFSANFRAAGEKAWNVYSIFLTDAVATDVDRREIGKIEENLERTRKLAASGISSREELIGVLLPLLSIQFQPKLPDGDITARLKRRIGEIAPGVRDITLDNAVPVADVLSLLGGRT